MSLGLQPFQRLDLNLEYLPLGIISQVIAGTTPFSAGNINEEKIIDHLSNVNSKLVEREIDFEELKKNYITAAGIYTFVQPLLNLGLDDPKEKFLAILNRGPYHVKSSLDLYFQEAEEEQTGRIESVDLLAVTQGIIDMQDTTDIILFKKSKTLQQRVKKELKFIEDQLNNSYSRQGHFSFVGYYDICTPLFAIDLRGDSFSQTDTFLKENFGVFLLQFPQYFRKDDYGE